MKLDDLLQGYIALSRNAVSVVYFRDQHATPERVYSNPAFNAMFQWDEVSGEERAPLHSVHPDDQEVARSHILRAIEARDSAVDFECRMLRGNGTEFWVSTSGTLVPADQGGVYLVTTFHDVSSIKERELSAAAMQRERDELYWQAEAAQMRLVAAINSYPFPFVIFDTDMEIITCNAAYRQSMAADPADIKPGMTFEEVLEIALSDGKLSVGQLSRKEFVRLSTDPQNFDTPVTDLELPNDVHHRVLRSRAENGDLVAIRLDTTEMVRQRRDAEANRARLLSALEAYPDPFAIFDNDRGLVVANSQYRKTLSDDLDEIQPGMHLREILKRGFDNNKITVPVKNREAWIENLVTLDIEANGIEDVSSSDGRHYRILRSRASNGDAIIVRQDTTELVEQRRAMEDYAQKLEVANDAILFEALHDQLTGLGNRRFLNEKFTELSRKRKKRGGELAALHIDLDRFKQINDTMGHAAGDKVLTDTADRIRTNLEPRDVVARIGGDEFVILLYIIDDPERPLELAENLLRDLSHPCYWEGKECRFGASIGLAATPLAQEDELLVDSDLALYKAKRAGRNQIGVFDRSDKEEMLRVKALADDILRGLEAGEFIPYYQPQVDANTGQIAGLEALARWQHPNRGVLAPDVFLGVATDLNVLGDIDRAIFDRAIDECSAAFAHSADPPSLSFNVSFNSVLSPDTDYIGRRARDYAGDVALELLETIFLEEASTEFLMQIDRFREMGLTIEVDDFGSGRASIVALQSIAPDRLKIDRQLITPLQEATRARHLVRSIVEIGHALGIGITAEGVETAMQAEVLAELGVDRLQGFLFSPPLPLPEILALIQKPLVPVTIRHGS